jgi:hypothetical protein
MRACVPALEWGLFQASSHGAAVRAGREATRDSGIGSAANYIWAMSKCKRCDGVAWVCESHPDKPWDRHNPRGCECGAGAPCPDCNRPKAGEIPRPPPGMIVDEIVEANKRRNRRNR